MTVRSWRVLFDDLHYLLGQLVVGQAPDYLQQVAENGYQAWRCLKMRSGRRRGSIFPQVVLCSWLSANLIGYETGALCDVLLQTVLDDEKYGFNHAASGARDATDNGSSLGDYTRGAALGHGRLWQLRQHEHHWVRRHCSLFQTYAAFATSKMWRPDNSVEAEAFWAMRSHRADIRS
ncbi:hypothetical protein QBC45DRAFT_490258 [Copromyces sp. CBS 386.78]|nr:hypothetical protein QBC45DRAFT_490258 [Copromyces sp. CBS 386.78]